MNNEVIVMISDHGTNLAAQMSRGSLTMKELGLSMCKTLIFIHTYRTIHLQANFTMRNEVYRFSLLGPPPNFLSNRDI